MAVHSQVPCLIIICLHDLTIQVQIFIGHLQLKSLPCCIYVNGNLIQCECLFLFFRTRDCFLNDGNHGIFLSSNSFLNVVIPKYPPTKRIIWNVYKGDRELLFLSSSYKSIFSQGGVLCLIILCSSDSHVLLPSRVESRINQQSNFWFNFVAVQLWYKPSSENCM